MPVTCCCVSVCLCASVHVYHRRKLCERVAKCAHPLGNRSGTSASEVLRAPATWPQCLYLLYCPDAQLKHRLARNNPQHSAGVTVAACPGAGAVDGCRHWRGSQPAAVLTGRAPGFVHAARSTRSPAVTPLNGHLSLDSGGAAGAVAGVRSAGGRARARATVRAAWRGCACGRNRPLARLALGRGLRHRYRLCQAWCCAGMCKDRRRRWRL